MMSEKELFVWEKNNNDKKKKNSQKTTDDLYTSWNDFAFML